MSNDDHKIYAMEFVDTREVDNKSPNMELRGFKKAVDTLERVDGLVVGEVITDAHPQIKAALKRDEFNHIAHQLDIWHYTKNLLKKLTAAGNKKDCNVILKWAGSIRNHLWFSAANCNGDVDRLKEIWVHGLHHVCNVHRWVPSSPMPEGCCRHLLSNKEHEHDPGDEKEWVKTGSKAHQELRQIFFEQKLLKECPLITRCRATSELESFHGHMLMYAAKRMSYSYLGYSVRMKLAAIDYSMHLDRHPLLDSEGNPRYTTKYSKSTKRYTPRIMLSPKSYDYISTLMVEIARARESNPQHLRTHSVMLAGDARRFQPRLSKIPKPRTSFLVRQKRKWGDVEPDT